MYVKNYIQRKCTHANLKQTTLNMNKEKAKCGSRYKCIVYRIFHGSKRDGKRPENAKQQKISA